MGVLIIPLLSGKLNGLTSHLTRSMVGKGLEILQEVQHREESSFRKHTVLLTTKYITKFIHHGHHKHIISQSLHSESKG